MATSLDSIENFLAQKRIAMPGISRNPSDFSVTLFDELCRRGYDIVPVNPNATEVQGQRCFARVQDIEPPVEAALLMTSPNATEAVVMDCAEAGVRHVWMYRATGKGAVSDKAISFCREHAIDFVPGECPFMFLPGAAPFHRFHGFLRKLTGRYPRRTPGGWQLSRCLAVPEQKIDSLLDFARKLVQGTFPRATQIAILRTFPYSHGYIFGAVAGIRSGHIFDNKI